MKFLHLVLFVLTIPSWPGHAQDSHVVKTTREVAAAMTETYEVNGTGAGELIAGTFKARGISATVTIWDPTNTKLRSFAVRDSRQVGFVSSKAGLYRLEVSATPTESTGSYSLELTTRSISP